MHHDQQQPEGIQKNLPFSSHQLLPGVKAALQSCRIGALDATAVDDRSRRLAVPSSSLAAESAKAVMNALPQTSDSPLSEVVVNGLAVGKSRAAFAI